MPAEYGEPLSKRELEVVALVVEGLTNREIALRLYLSPNTVKVHLRNIFTKTGVASRTELSILAVKEGWVQLEGVEESAGAGEAAVEAPAVEAAAAVAPAPLPTETAPPLESAPALALSRRQVLSLLLGLLMAAIVLFLPAPRGQEAAAPVDSGLVEQAPVQPLGEAIGETEWVELPPMPVRRARLGLAAWEGRLYAVGGLTAEGPTDRLEVYEIEAKRWHEGTPRPLAAANVAAVALEGQLFVPGGCDAQGQPLAESDRYRIEEDRWEPIAPLPEPLCAYALAALDGKLYLFGGWDGSRYRALTYVYDPSGDRWREAAPPTVARGFGAAAAYGGRLYYVGGFDGHELDTCEVYDPAGDRWSSCTPMLLPRGGLGLVAVGANLYAIGGGWEHYLGFNERYAPAEDRWTVIGSPMLGMWRNLGVATWETDLYAVGGWSGDYLNRLYATSLMPFRIFIPATMP